VNRKRVDQFKIIGSVVAIVVLMVILEQLG